MSLSIEQAAGVVRATWPRASRRLAEGDVAGTMQREQRRVKNARLAAAFGVLAQACTDGKQEQVKRLLAPPRRVVTHRAPLQKEGLWVIRLPMSAYVAMSVDCWHCDEWSPGSIRHVMAPHNAGLSYSLTTEQVGLLRTEATDKIQEELSNGDCDRTWIRGLRILVAKCDAILGK